MPFPSPALPVSAYIDQEWFDKEQTLLFGRLWQFATLASLVDKPNKFVTKKLFGIPIVVQNFSGELKAFENICLHRQAPIQSAVRGCRPLTCGYHGWNYGADGKVAAIPFEGEYYKFPASERNEMRLREFAVAKIGGAVFINMSADPLPIEKQFSQEFINSLAGATSQFDTEIIATTFRRTFNWKLIFENLRDGLHASFLHRDTLYENVKFRPAAPEMDKIQAYLDERGRRSNDPLAEVRDWFSKGGPDAPLEELTPYPWHEKVERYGNENVYYNWLAFPNLHIASGNGGYAFIIEHYIPRGPAATDVDVYYLTARRKKPYASSKAVLYEHLAGAEAVLSEDFQMVESIQKTLHADAPAPHWGAFELRNHRISSWIAQVVNGEIAI